MANGHLNRWRSPKQILRRRKRFQPLQLNQGLDIIVRRILIHAISFYQRRISPHKKFSCAYRVLYNSHSCSQGAKEILKNYSLFEALPRIQKQFHQCRQAVRIIRDRRIHSPRCSHVATSKIAAPENILFPTLGESVFSTRRGDPGYISSPEEESERSRRDRRRRNDSAGSQPYNSWCDCNVCYCADFDVQPNNNECCCDGPGDCGDSCFGCDGCDFCVADCA
ncbi:MAG: membrane protein insertion efficiency factor YidD [Cyanobacteria bacterium P01_C01_bin.89]